MTTTPANLAEMARLADPDFYVGDPHPVYARLRDEAPVWWCETGNFWALTGHADITAVAAKHALFSSAHGSFIPDARYPDKVKHRGVPGTSVSFGIDPPDHTNYRHLISAAFTPRAVRHVEQLVRRLVVGAVEAIKPKQAVDVVETLSVPTSLNVITALLGVPPTDWADFKRWTDDLSGHVDAVPGSEEESRMRIGMENMESYLLDQLNYRRRNPTDDWPTMIATTELDGRPTSREFQVSFARALLVAGNETTRNTISSGVIALA